MASQSWKSKQLSRIAERDGSNCRYCGRQIIGTVHLEHINPKAWGGGNQVENLGISCPTCNSRKGAWAVDEFRNGISSRMVKRINNGAEDALAYLSDYVSPEESAEIYSAYQNFIERVKRAKVTFWVERGRN